MYTLLNTLRYIPINKTTTEKFPKRKFSKIFKYLAVQIVIDKKSLKKPFHDTDRSRSYFQHHTISTALHRDRPCNAIHRGHRTATLPLAISWRPTNVAAMQFSVRTGAHATFMPDYPTVFPPPSLSFRFICVCRPTIYDYNTQTYNLSLRNTARFSHTHTNTYTNTNANSTTTSSTHPTKRTQFHSVSSIVWRTPYSTVQRRSAAPKVVNSLSRILRRQKLTAKYYADIFAKNSTKCIQMYFKKEKNRKYL